MAGQKNDFCFRFYLLNFFHGLETAQSRHLHIEHQDIEVILAKQGNRIFAAGHPFCVDIAKGEAFRKGGDHLFLIIYQQNLQYDPLYSNSDYLAMGTRLELNGYTAEVIIPGLE